MRGSRIIVALVGLGLLGVTRAEAKGPGWLQNGASSVDIRATTDLKLHRGPTTRYLPAVPIHVPVAGQEATRPVLAVIDVAGRWSRVSLEMANALAMEWSWVNVAGVDRRIAVLDEIVIGEDVVLKKARVEVVESAPGFVLGLGSLDEVAVAILPSKGLVRLVPAKQADGLIRSVAEPVRVTSQPSKPFVTELGQTVNGDGLTLRVPGALRWGETTVSGSVHLRTDEPISLVAASSRLPEPTSRGGEPYHEVGARLGDVWLADTWIRETPELVDPAPDFYAALGYDVLYGVDLAVSVSDGVVAFAHANQVRWTDADPVAVAFARERYTQEEARLKGTGNETGGPDGGRVQIGFDGPQKQQLLLGDPGNPVVRDRNLDLAETLWLAGDLEEALQHYLAASRHAGDQCLSHLRLGERRLAWAGSQQEKALVVDLVRDPLERAATLWSTWESLDPVTRNEITSGRNQPEGQLQVFQPSDCRTARGPLLASSYARGDLIAAQKVESAHGTEPSVSLSRGLQALREGSWDQAEPLLQAAARRDGGSEVDIQLAMALAKGGLKERAPLVELLRAVPGYPSDHPLTAAFIGLEAGVLIGDPAGVTRKLWRADDRWLPGELVYRWASDTIAELGEWDPSVEHRQPGRPQVLCQKAVHLALGGRLEEARTLLAEVDAPHVADWWTATAVVAHVAKDPVARDTALYELRLRYPLIPAGRMGLR